MINLPKNRSDARLCQNTVKKRLVWHYPTVALDLMNASTSYGKIDVANSAERKGSNPLPTGCHPELAPLCLPLTCYFFLFGGGDEDITKQSLTRAQLPQRSTITSRRHACAKLICEVRVYMLQDRYRASAVLDPSSMHVRAHAPHFRDVFRDSGKETSKPGFYWKIRYTWQV